MEATTNGYAKYIKLLLYILVIILLNLVGLTQFFRLDLTKNKIYSLSPASKQVARTLSEPLTIKVFFTKDLPAPHNNTQRYLQDLLNEYALSNKKYFKPQFYNVTPETEGMSDAARENREMARDYGINPVQIQIVEKDEVKFKQAFMGLVLIHGDIIERIPTITSTEGLEYKLTTAIQKLNNKVSALLNLEEKVQVKLVLSSSVYKVAPLMGLKTLNNYPKLLKKIVDELNPKTYGKLAFSHINPDVDEASANTLERFENIKISWPSYPKANLTEGAGFIGMLLQYKNDVREIPLLKIINVPIFGTQYQLTQKEEIEEIINTNLERMVNINEDLGILADHGSLNTSPMGPRGENTISRFRTLVEKTYALKTINLKEDAIPNGLKCLVIPRPTEKLSDYALYQIDQALMSGTNLAIFADAFKEVRPAGQQPFMANQMPNYVPLDTGLEKLLAHYGVRIKKSLVLDEECFRQRKPPQQGGGDQPIYFAPIIQNDQINKNLDYIKNIKGLITVKISPLELDQQRIDDQKVTAHQLFASSKRSWEMRDRITLNPMFLRPPASDKEMSSLPLAYMLEGSFSSYFKGKSIPEKPVDEAQNEETDKTAEDKQSSPSGSEVDLSQITAKGAVLGQSPPARIFVVATGEILKDQLLDDAGQSTNAMFILNMIDALNDQEAFAAMRSKEQRFNPLKETTAASKAIIKAVNMVGLPVLVVIFGLAVWMYRHARRKKIQLLFQR